MAMISIAEFVPKDTLVEEADNDMLAGFIAANKVRLDASFADGMRDSVILPLNATTAECTGADQPMIVFSEIEFGKVDEGEKQFIVANLQQQWEKYTTILKNEHSWETVKWEKSQEAHDAGVKDDEGNIIEVLSKPADLILPPMPGTPEDTFILRRVTLNDHFVVSLVQQLTEGGDYTKEQVCKIMLVVRHIMIDNARQYAWARYAQEEATNGEAIHIDGMEELDPCAGCEADLCEDCTYEKEATAPEVILEGK